MGDIGGATARERPWRGRRPITFLLLATAASLLLALGAREHAAADPLRPPRADVQATHPAALVQVPAGGRDPNRPPTRLPTRPPTVPAALLGACPRRTSTHASATPALTPEYGTANDEMRTDAAAERLDAAPPATPIAANGSRAPPVARDLR